MRAGIHSTVIEYCPFCRATFEVLTAVLLEIEVFWYAKPCRYFTFLSTFLVDTFPVYFLILFPSFQALQRGPSLYHTYWLATLSGHPLPVLTAPI